MTRKSLVLLAGLSLMILMMAMVSGCAFRDQPASRTPCFGTEDVQQAKMVMNAADKDSLNALRHRLDMLEKRVDANEKLANEANMTAQKALKCCRGEYTVVASETINFDFNKFNIRTEDYEKLDRVAAKLKEDPDLKAECIGNTDGIGSVDYNIVLGQRRAEAARSYLINKHNIDAGRIAIRTMGKDAPVASNDTENGRFENRRVRIDVLGFAP